MKIEQVKISAVKPNPDNPRIIKDDKFLKLVQSLRDFPKMMQIRPIVVNADMVVLGGNMRLRAAKDAGYKEVYIIRADELTPEQQREFIIKDNVGFGEWDYEALANEWDAAQLEEWGLDLPGFDIDAENMGDAFTLADGDKAPFQRMAFILADAQAERIKQALKDVSVQPGTEYGNENSNGNALHQIVLEWAEQKILL